MPTRASVCIGLSYGSQRVESLVAVKYLFDVLALQGNERKHNERLSETLQCEEA
jgi:hypothetical protein